MVDLLKKYDLGAVASSKIAPVDSASSFKQLLLGELSRTKTDSLASMAEAVTQETEADIARARLSQQEQVLREASAWAKDAELGTPTGIVKAGVASAYSGINRMVQQVASAPSTMQGTHLAGQVDDIGKTLYNLGVQDQKTQAALDVEQRNLEAGMLNGSISEEDGNVQFASIVERRNASPRPNAQENEYLDAPYTPPIAPGGEGYGLENTPSTRRQLLQESQAAFERAENVRLAFENSGVNKTVNPLNREKLSADIKASYEANSHHFASAEQALDVGDYGTATLEGLAGIAKLVVAGAGDIVSNPAATFEFVAENAPQLAVGGISTKLLAATNLAYGVDIYSQAVENYAKENNGAVPSSEETAIMLGFSLSASAMENVADLSILKAFKNMPGGTAATEKVIEEVTGGILSKMAGSSIAKVAGEVGVGVAREGVTEVYQTAVEENLSRLNTNFDGASLFEAGVIGGAAGGVMSGTGAAVSEMSSGVVNAANTERAVRGDREAKAAAFVGAVATGDVSVFLNKDDKAKYSPAMAAAALTQRILKEDTPPEDVVAHKAQVEQLIVEQTAVVDDVVARIMVAVQEGSTASKQETDALSDELDEAREVLTNMKAVREVPTTAARMSPEELTAVVTQAEETSEPSQVISLMMEDPGLFDGQDQLLTKLTANTGFTQPQKEFLQNFTAAHAEINALQDLDKVNSDVLSGRSGFKGLSEFESDVAAALRNKDKPTAEKEITSLREFYKNHLGKERAYTEAAELSKQTGKPVFVIKDYSKPSGWYAAAVQPKGWSQKTNGGFTVHPSTAGQAEVTRRIAMMKQENSALLTMGKQLRSAVDLAFGSAAPTVAPVVEQTTASAAVVKETPPKVVEPAADPKSVAKAPVKASAPAAANATPVTESAPVAETVAPKVEEAKAESGILPNIQNSTGPKKGNLTLEELGVTDLISAYFEQRTAGKTAATSNPLIEVKDFVSAVLGKLGFEALTKFLGDEALSAKQAELLGHFVKFAKTFNEQIAKNMNTSKPSPLWKHRDYAQFFRDSMPENVRTAISAAAFTWLSENGNSLINYDDDIRAMAGLTSDDVVSSELRNLLIHAGTRENLVVQELGKRAAQALGLYARKDAPANSQAQLELALGAHALAALLQAGALERIVVNSPLLIRDEDSLGLGQPFIRIAQTELGVTAIPDVVEVVTAAKDTGSIINKLFSVESSLVGPSLRPDGFDQEKTKGTEQGIPSVLADIAKRMSSRKHKLREDMRRVRNAFSPDNVAVMAGAVHVDQQYNHSTRKQATESKNNGILREIERMNEFENGLTQKFFYFVPKIWSQQRAGLSENLVNPQTSKFQRHNVTMDAWATEVDPTIENETLTSFKLAVAQGMGLKTDKQLNKESLRQLKELMSSEKILFALEALDKIAALPEGETLSPEDQDAVTEAVAKGGENFHSLDALVSWSQYLRAKEQGVPFTTDIMYEVDGVTNGPALAHVQLGMAGRFGRMFGMYTAEDQYTGYTQYKSTTGNLDLYETVAEQVQHYLSQRRSSATDAILHFTGNISNDDGVTSAGRKLVKQPLTSMVFGAGLNKAVNNMGEAFVELFYERLEEDANNGDLAALQFSVKQLNFLLNKDDQLVPPVSLEAAMELKLTGVQARQVRDAFGRSVGQSVKEALKRDFEQFIDRRNELNKGAQALWGRYNAALEYLYVKKLREKIASGELAANKPKDGSAPAPYQDLAQEDIDQIIEELKPLQPLIHTAMSKASGDLSAGLDISKTENAIVPAGSKDFGLSYSAEVKFGIPFASGDPAQPKQNSLKPRAMKKVSGDPGVRAVIMLVHALDSAIASYSYSGVSALNIHDALGLGLNKLFKGAKLLNKNTYQLLADYSVSREIYEALERSFAAESALVELHPGLTAILANVKVGRGEYTEPVNAQLLQGIQITAIQADVGRLSFLESLTSVDQYALEDGAYEVTAEDRKAVGERLAQVRAEMSSVLDGPVAQEPAPQARPLPEDTPFGVVGVPAVDSDPVLVKAIEAADGKSARSLLAVLSSQIGTGTSAQAFMHKLLEQISKTLPADTLIRYITPTTAPTQEDDTKFGPVARAWYRLDGNGKRINIKSPEFLKSGITPELVVHEFVHASLAQTIDRLQKGKTPNASIVELEQLVSLAKAFIEKNGLNQFAPAVTDVQELVAWGMTNPAFQTEVLAKIRMESTAGQRSRESGLRAFIRNLAQLFFGAKVAEAATNGMGILIANTGLLFEEAGKASQPEQDSITLGMVEPDPRTFTTDEVYRALATGTLSPSFDLHLRAALARVVDVVYGPGGALKAAAERSAPVTADDVFLNALASGNAPFASKLTAQLPMSDQEAFVAESIELAVRESIKGQPLLQRGLRKLWSQTKSEVTAADFFNGDWALASPSEKETAQQQHDLIFTAVANADGSSDYLSQFVAAAMTYQPLFNKLASLKKTDDTGTLKGKSLGDQIKLVFARIMNHLARLLTKTDRNQTVGSTLATLAVRAATLEARRKATLQRKQERPDTWIEEKARDATKLLNKGAEKLVKAKPIRESKYAIVRATGAVIGTIAGDRVDKLFDGLKTLRDGANKSRLGVTAEIINEMRNGRDSLVWANDLLDDANTHEQNRKRAMVETGKFVMDGFGKELSEPEQIALTRFLRADPGKLLESYTLAEIEAMLSDPKALEAAIQLVEKRVTGVHRKYYLSASKGLGYFMVTGKTRVQNLMLNAHNIAFLANTSKMKEVSVAEGNEAMETLDTLISLYALRYTSPNVKAIASDLMRSEGAREAGNNGVEQVLLLHNKFSKDAKETLFEGSPIHMIKGYTKDIYNPFVETLAATKHEGKQLELAGYVLVGKEPVGKDAADLSEPKYLYVIRDKGLSETVTGFMPYTGRRQRGTTIHSGLTHVDGELNITNARMQADVATSKNAAIEAMFSMDESFDPAASKERNLMVPVLNHAGQASNYRYLMEDATKDSVKGRRNHIGEVMGAIAGSLLDKAGAPALSRNGVDAIKAEFDRDYLGDQNAFIDFSEQSTDPVIRERFRQLPSETKDYIRKTWGRNGMWIRNDAYNLAFGYRKYSIMEVFESVPERNEHLKRVLVWALGQVMITGPSGKPEYVGSARALKLLAAENAWQEIVKVVKDILVIKNLFTLVGNEMSNFTLLALAGVPFAEIAKNKVTAINATLTYQADRKERDALQRQIDSEYIVGKERAIAEQRIVELNDTLLKNPVRVLIEAGMFQTLVEDISAEEDPYSYKSRLTRWSDSKTQFIPKPLKAVGNTLILAHNTPLYKFLNQATVLSDFTSRYVLHQHLTTRRFNPLSKADSLQRVRAAFINYDAPTQKGLQYLNDMGLLWFTKYYLRVQAVILQLVKENPLRALALVGLNQVHEFADILDSSMFQQTPGNLGMGALELPGAIDEIITLKVAGSVW